MSYCIRVDIDDTATPCPTQCQECLAAEGRPFWAKRPGYGPAPAILHLVADATDKHAACGAHGTHERWMQASTGVKCDACQHIEGAEQ